MAKNASGSGSSANGRKITTDVGSSGVVAAFDVAANFKARLIRYERQQILLKAFDTIWERRDSISDTITLELGISRKDSLYE